MAAGEEVGLPGEVAPAGENGTGQTREERKAAKKAKNKAESQLKRNVSWKDDKTNNEELVQVKEYRVSNDGGGVEETYGMEEPPSACCTIS